MVQTALALFVSSFGMVVGWLRPWLPLLIILLLAWGLLGLLGRRRWTLLNRWLRPRGQATGRWALALLALGVGVLGLETVRRSVDAGLGQALNARYSSSADPDTAPTQQPAPQVSLLSQRTYTRTLTLPPLLLRRVTVEGVQVLAPYLEDPSSANILRLRDRFTRSGSDVLFTREATLLTEAPVALTASTIRATLTGAQGRSGARAYAANFAATYRFRNPQPQPALLRFVFPLPVGSGTLDGFSMTVNGQPYRPANTDNLGIWEAQVPASVETEIKVAYRHQGSRGWSYLMSGRRQPVSNFDLTLSTDAAPAFARYSLLPTSRSSGLVGPEVLRWQLKDAVTAQDIALVFAQGSVRETLRKLHLSLPLVLTLTALLLLIWSASRRLPLPPLRLGAALLALALGWALGGVLVSYLPAALAELIGAALGLALATALLGRASLLPLLIGAAAPLCFLWPGNAGLLLVLLAALTLLGLAWPLLGRRQLPVRGAAA